MPFMKNFEPSGGSVADNCSVSQPDSPVNEAAINVAQSVSNCVTSLDEYRKRKTVNLAAEYNMNRRQEAEDITMHRRLKAAMRQYRLMRGWNQATMADFLRVTKINYQKYELNSLDGQFTKVPYVVAMRFCLQTGQNPLDLAFPPSKRAKA